MKFFTTVEIAPLARKLGYEHKLMFVGSCFAESLCKHLCDLKMTAAQNPFGVVYNPHSLAQSLRRMGEKRLLVEDDLRRENGLWFSYTHHGRFAHHDKDECLRLHNESVMRGSWALRTADFLVLTLGTAWAYRHKASGEVVANCHKSPASEFERIFITPDEVTSLLCEAVSRVQRINPEVYTVITVSPVRHFKDGAHGSQLSKAALLLGVDEAVKRCTNTCYFPAYEIVMDELRDYRFYAADMLHPSDTAADYVCERFEQAALSDEAVQTMAEVRQLMAAMQHRPLHAQSQEYRAFCELQLRKIAQLRQQWPHISWENEEQFFAKN
ncbi:MAG: GSCFA domain-containing protein [Prevotellaceae bacterium]|nr:GSCFA domain-containing protein [Prevotellaceae bacterium]